MRDITLGITFYQYFTTRIFATGIPGTLAGSPVISAYEDNNVTQITAGVSLSVDFDSVTGLNLITVVATSGNGFENGKSYALVITVGTVSGVSVVGEVVGEFTVGQSAAAVDLANATDGLSALKALIDAIPTTAMRGTDDAALASVATEARLSELDAATGGKMANQVDLVKTEADKIALVDAGAGVAGSVIEEVENRATPAQVGTELGTYDGPTKAEMDTGHANVTVGTNNDKTGYALSTAGILAIWDQATSALTTAGRIGKLLVDNVDAAISSRSSHAAAAVWSVATRLLTAGTNIVLAKGIGVTGFNDVSAADVNAEVVDVINTDTSAEPGQGAPAATASLRTKIDYMFKSWRNKKTQSATSWELYNDAAAVVDQKAAVSEVASVVTKDEVVTGP